MGIGVPVPTQPVVENHGSSAALTMGEHSYDTVTRDASHILAADGSDSSSYEAGVEECQHYSTIAS